MNTLKSLSYFEFMTNYNSLGVNLYVSAFPTTKVCDYAGPLVIPDFIFKDISKDKLFEYTQVLQRNNFGVSDFLWFVNWKDNITIGNKITQIGEKFERVSGDFQEILDNCLEWRCSRNFFKLTFGRKI